MTPMVALGETRTARTSDAISRSEVVAWTPPPRPPRASSAVQRADV